MVSISFKANSVYVQPNNKQYNTQTLSPKAQEVLNKTNKYACGINMIDSLSKPDKDINETLKNRNVYGNEQPISKCHIYRNTNSKR